MVLGFNHNIRYRGELFHVQTEDSGRANPHIITLLYRGGTILASAKTSYADIIKTEQLELVVESIMKEQHKQMMRRLKAGEFDARIFPPGSVPPSDDATSSTGTGSPKGGETATPQPAPAPEPATVQPHHDAQAAATQPQAVHKPLSASQPASGPQPINSSPSPTSPPAPPTKRSLDEVILDYLITGEEK